MRRELDNRIHRRPLSQKLRSLRNCSVFYAGNVHLFTLDDMDDEIDIGTIRIQSARKSHLPVGSLFRFSEDSSFSSDGAKLADTVKDEGPLEPPPESFLRPLEQEKIGRLRRWIYGIAVGKSLPTYHLMKDFTDFQWVLNSQF